MFPDKPVDIIPMKIKELKCCLSIYIITIFLVACQNQEQNNNLNEVYPISLHESINPPESAEEWIEEMEFVPLETNPDCYLASRMKYDISDTHIALSSNNAVHIFDSKGNHLNTFKKEGKGPGEYVQIHEIRLMPGSDEVMISDPNGRKIIIYDYQGSPTSYIPVKFMMMDVVPVDSDILAVYLGRMSRAYVEDTTMYEMAFINREGEIISKYRPFKYTFPRGVTAVDFTGPEKPGQFYINIAYTTNIYQVGPGDNFDLLYRFDYLDYAIDTTLLDDKRFMESPKADYNLKGFTDLDHIAVNKNSIMFWAPDVDKKRWGFRLINRKTGNQRSVFMDSTQIFGYFHGIPIQFGRSSYADWFIQKTEALDLKEAIEKLSPDQLKYLSKSKGFKSLEGLKEDDNPVLVFYKVKDF
jgi:hypothetical protein